MLHSPKKIMKCGIVTRLDGKIQVLCVARLCQLVNRYQHFRGIVPSYSGPSSPGTVLEFMTGIGLHDQVLLDITKLLVSAYRTALYGQKVDLCNHSVIIFYYLLSSFRNEYQVYFLVEKAAGA
jgi:hypothetical protein